MAVTRRSVVAGLCASSFLISRRANAALVASPDDYGPPTGDDSPICNTAIAAINAAGGGVLQLKRTYNLGSYSANGLSMVGLKPGVDIVGLGKTTGFRLNNGVNVSNAQFAHILGSYDPVSLGRIRFKDFLLDYNGLNNCGSGTLWALNAMLAIELGDDIDVDTIGFINNCGSNSILIGENKYPATTTNIRVRGCHFSNNGDRINPAATDFSACWLTAANASVSGSTFDLGPMVNGAAIELHGQNLGASDNSIRDYFNGMNISNENPGRGGSGPNSSYNISAIGNRMFGVKCGFTLYSRSVTSLVNTTIAMNTIRSDPDFRYFIDADSAVDPTGNNINLMLFANNCQVASNGSPAVVSRSGFRLGSFASITAKHNQLFNVPGPAIDMVHNYAGGGVVDLSGNVMGNCGFTSSAADKLGIRIGGANAFRSLNVCGNTIEGTSLTAGISGGPNATKGRIGENVVTGLVNPAADIVYSGSGVTVVHQ